MNVSNGRVEAVGTKAVETRFGTKNTYSVKVDGQWYKFGFKDPKLAAGDVVSFEYTPGKYGNEVDSSTLKKGSAPAEAKASEPAARAETKTYTRAGVFPIPALDGQRSIVRQNALTNARESVVAAHGGKPFALDIEAFSSVVIQLAKKYEAYTAGDMDLEMAKASIEADEATKH